MILRKHIGQVTMVATILFVVLVSFSATARTPKAFYVSPSGNDGNNGSLKHPFLTINRARDAVRLVNKNMKGDIVIYLLDGTYRLSAPISFSEEDSGQNGHNVIYMAYKNAKPILSGGVPISTWTLHDANRNIYKTSIPAIADSRQLYVNGRRATRARSIDATGWTETGDGYDCPASVSSWKNIERLEVVSNAAWRGRRGLVARISGTHATMTQPYWEDVHKMKLDAPATWIENAYELLDEPGEWYHDTGERVLYYKPLPGENMQTADVILPVLETLVEGRHLNNVHFKGLTFMHATWLFPNSIYGFSCRQADYVFSKGQFQVPGNLVFDHSNNLVFEGNTFTRLGITGLQLSVGCNNNVIDNNTFRDISGSALSLGYVGKTPVFENTLKEPDLIKNNTITNNFIRDVGVEYFGCVGMFIGYTIHTVVTHNELRNLPYSGISLGWGWNNAVTASENCEVSYNRIDSVMTVLSDGAAIYTLSSQPGTTIHHNYISNQLHYAGALYPDEGSSEMHWHHNVVQGVTRWLHIWTPTIQNNIVDFNFSDNTDQRMEGTNCIVKDNVFVSGTWPEEAIAIMNQAGRQVKENVKANKKD